MSEIRHLWCMCDEANRYRWRAVVAFVACALILPFMILEERDG